MEGSWGGGVLPQGPVFTCKSPADFLIPKPYKTGIGTPKTVLKSREDGGPFFPWLPPALGNWNTSPCP